MKFTTIAQIEAAPTKDLIDFYNEVNPEKPVKKFADRQTALKRCIALLEVEEESAEEQQTAKVKADLEEAHAEFAAEGGEALETSEPEVAEVSEDQKADDEDAEPAESEKKFKWPFTKGGKPIDQEAKTEGEEDDEDDEEKPAKKSNVGHASNSAGVAASWANDAVAAARLTRDGVSVTVNGKTTEHKSTREAFRHYRLLDSKHIRFRGQLKEARDLVYNENGVDYQFKIIALAKEEKPAKAKKEKAAK